MNILGLLTGKKNNWWTDKKPFLFYINIYPTQDNEGYDGIENYMVIYSHTKEEAFIKYMKQIGKSPLLFKKKTQDEWELIDFGLYSIICSELPEKSKLLQKYLCQRITRI